MIRRIWALGPTRAVEDLSRLQLGYLSNALGRSARTITPDR